MSIQIHRFTWHDGAQDVEIKVIYHLLRWGVISHFEIESERPERAPLPITNTGDLSHFFHPDSADFSEQGVVAFIKNWLDEEKAKSHWQERLEDTQQYQLF